MSSRNVPALSEERRAAFAYELRRVLPWGSAVYGGVTEVNRVGTVRYLKLFVAPTPVEGFRPIIRDITHMVALYLGLRYDGRRGAIPVVGAGHDPRLHVVSLLARALYDDQERALVTERLF